MRIEKTAAVMFSVMVEECCTVWQWTASKLTNGPRTLLKKYAQQTVPLFCNNFYVIAQSQKASMYCMGE